MKFWAGRGLFGSRSSARYQGQRWHGFACGRAFLFGFHGRSERPVRRFPLRFSLFFLQPRQVSARWSATDQGPSVLAWTSIEQSSAAARSGEKNTVGNTVCGYGSCCPVGGEKRGLCCTATLENPADPGVDPYPGAWVLPTLASIIVEPDAVRAIHNIYCFGPPHWKEQCWVGFLPGLEAFEKKCCCKVPHVSLSFRARPPKPRRRTRHSFAKNMPTHGWTP